MSDAVHKIINSVIDKYSEPYFPHVFCADMRANNITRNVGRYGFFTFSDYGEILQLSNYLDGVERTLHLAAGRGAEKGSHWVGSLNAFAVLYRHVTFCGETKPLRHVWQIPSALLDWKRVENIIMPSDTTRIRTLGEDLRSESFISALKAGWFSNTEFADDVRALGETRVFFHSTDEITLESDYKGDLDWMTKWTMLKLRWT